MWGTSGSLPPSGTLEEHLRCMLLMIELLSGFGRTGPVIQLHSQREGSIAEVTVKRCREILPRTVRRRPWWKVRGRSWQNGSGVASSPCNIAVP